ncbi:ATP-dependent DNA helicase [Prosthecomicrobium pneumaticum]|uniref:Exodeoxyribonuclease-5 n=1 Tax=Prosthecomicrobium pneumaticum TaxID=81895 RepID=A0A7W9CSF8_9HYPH|nr:ATP-dependent RecD-like DNA helicase [Prosthecomicrobium pneumaticum]MBB5751080.1 exodeoxyribonuclease-5 [Prosthecomicrobium pneumaticum]
MRWSPQQEAALAAVSRWLKRGDSQIFRLFGYAGTGKTTLARHIAEGQDGDVAFAAFTGKAAHVLRQKGCEGAGTIHSLIYRPRAVEAEEETPTFALNRDSAAAKADLIIIDECSMVDEELGRDLLSFGTPVLVLGDPAQLPPVKGGGFFTEAEPDEMLTEVHRQAQDDPIIRLSMAARVGEGLDYGVYGETSVIPRRAIDAERILAADQVLVGTNRTRRAYNGRIRALKGLLDPMPAAGDKLVCLRNDKQKGLLNGGTWTVTIVSPPRKGLLRLSLVPEDEPGGRSVRVSVNPAFFEDGGEGLAWPERRKSDEFDYGYALTVHKAQGSQWDDVVLFDEGFAFREHRDRWLYTGITRAAKRLTIVR